MCVCLCPSFQFSLSFVSFYLCVHVCYRSCLLLHVCVYLCVGQGSRHAAVCRSAVPVHGRTADDAAAADGGGPEVVGTGRKAAGNTHIENKLQSGTILTSKQPI